jgi:hypothetical protein
MTFLRLIILSLTITASASGMSMPKAKQGIAIHSLDSNTIEICSAFEAGTRPGDEVLAFNEWKPKSVQDAKVASGTAASTTDTRLSYEKVVDIYTSYKQQTLVHLTLDNGQRLTATEGHPFKTTDGWRDAVLLKKGGQLLLKGGEGDAEAVAADLQSNRPLAQQNNAQEATESVASSAINNSQAANAAQPGERAITIADIRLEVTTVAVYNLEVANAHTFFVGADGVLVHNGGKGVYWFPEGVGVYVGKAASFVDRLGKHFRAGRMGGPACKINMPDSTENDRRIVEGFIDATIGYFELPTTNRIRPPRPKY